MSNECNNILGVKWV